MGNFFSSIFPSPSLVQAEVDTGVAKIKAILADIDETKEILQELGERVAELKDGLDTEAVEAASSAPVPFGSFFLIMLFLLVNILKKTPPKNWLGPAAQMSPGPKRAVGPNGPWAKRALGPMGPGAKRALGPGSKWALGPNGPWAQTGAGPKQAWAQMDPGLKWALGPNGPWAQMVPWPKQALGPNGPWAQIGTGTKWAQMGPGPNGPWDQMGPGPKWAGPNISVQYSRDL